MSQVIHVLTCLRYDLLNMKIITKNCYDKHDLDDDALIFFSLQLINLLQG